MTADAFPMPDPAPVTNATFPSKSIADPPSGLSEKICYSFSQHADVFTKHSVRFPE
ncbi:hypothetical protein QTA58_08280 [Neorhizobium sp. CSC1952]|uniref:hypothetical protein n=1 Tax=Neorhizobium sp. CSC1952 TaxID=2978974 RepID=UPI0025A55A5C|nr:hypothetical protein [Rhizobium sp. CSC1952]WJR69655.1 hypothetical protein QTA58_08280 [Rhizobium sp. CSC1952]